MRGVTLTFTTNPNNCCPKCGAEIITDFTFLDKIFRRKKPKRVRMHIKKCKSTLIADSAKHISDKIDNMILKDLMKKTTAN